MCIPCSIKCPRNVPSYKKSHPSSTNSNPRVLYVGEVYIPALSVSPSLPTTVEVTYLTHITAVIEWRVDSIAFSPELYTLMYSTTADDLNTIMTEPQFSGTNITVTGQVYSVRLENLSPGTRYYYQIKVENTVGITLTDISAFSTRKSPTQYWPICAETLSKSQLLWGHLRTL